MEHEGLVSSTWEASFTGPDRRRYQLTAAGERCLDAWAATLRETKRGLDVFLGRVGATRLALEQA